jgi:riboflavin transporter
MSNVNTKNNVRTIAVTGMLSAVAVVLMYLEIPIPIMPGFIKFDFSDLPALLGAYALGPVAGIIICLIKNVVHLAASQSMLVGELSNFILGSVFVFTAGIVYKKKKSKTGALLGGLCGAMAMGVFSVFSKYALCINFITFSIGKNQKNMPELQTQPKFRHISIIYYYIKFVSGYNSIYEINHAVSDML